MATCIHELEDWPHFRWDTARIAQQLAAVRHQQGRLLGRLERLGFPLRAEAVLATLTEDVVKSSEIEGEHLDKAQVRSSIARRLGMDVGALPPPDRHVDGVVEMMLDATQKFDTALTKERLFGWHAAMFPTGRTGMSAIMVGAWRDDASGPMRVVSGPMGRERIHFRAPAAPLVEKEMSAFLSWFETDQTLDPVLKASVAHLWFVTIHPFDDGNGRIARAIADMALARSEHSAQRFYSMSAQIRPERRDYYNILETTQRGTLEITGWLEWFLGCLDRAIQGAEDTLSSVLRKARFWESFREFPLNKRQCKVLNRLLDGFEGKITSAKWAALTQSSPDTALRDIHRLLSLGILRRNPGRGRSTSYSLVELESAR